MTIQDFFSIDTTLLSIKPNPANRYLQFIRADEGVSVSNRVPGDVDI
jgi:hypothetical protein